MKTTLLVLAALAATAASTSAFAADTNWGAGADDAAFKAMVQSSFREKGIAKLSRLDQDATQAFCSDPMHADDKDSAKLREKIEAENMAAIKWPADGKYLGDWKNGERIAQEGRGKQYSDDPKGPVGGNCYACHQISPKEISYGTIGPSLTGYGKTHKQDEATLKQTWARIYNSKATNACSNMPRGGHMGIITEQQIRDIMALLLDPQSPVNQ